MKEELGENSNVVVVSTTSSRPTPTEPTAPPSPADGNCRGVGAWRGRLDSWCTTNCNNGFCPAAFC